MVLHLQLGASTIVALADLGVLEHRVAPPVLALAQEANDVPLEEKLDAPLGPDAVQEVLVENVVQEGPELDPVLNVKVVLEALELNAAPQVENNIVLPVREPAHRMENALQKCAALVVDPMA